MILKTEKNPIFKRISHYKQSKITEITSDGVKMWFFFSPYADFMFYICRMGLNRYLYFFKEHMKKLSADKTEE